MRIQDPPLTPLARLSAKRGATPAAPHDNFGALRAAADQGAAAFGKAAQGYFHVRRPTSEALYAATVLADLHEGKPLRLRFNDGRTVAHRWGFALRWPHRVAGLVLADRFEWGLVPRDLIRVEIVATLSWAAEAVFRDDDQPRGRPGLWEGVLWPVSRKGQSLFADAFRRARDFMTRAPSEDLLDGLRRLGGDLLTALIDLEPLEDAGLTLSWRRYASDLVTPDPRFQNGALEGFVQGMAMPHPSRLHVIMRPPGRPFSESPREGDPAAIAAWVAHFARAGVAVWGAEPLRQALIEAAVGAWGLDPLQGRPSALPSLGLRAREDLRPQPRLGSSPTWGTDPVPADWLEECALVVVRATAWGEPLWQEDPATGWLSLFPQDQGRVRDCAWELGRRSPVAWDPRGLDVVWVLRSWFPSNRLDPDRARELFRARQQDQELDAREQGA